ncbi:MULTISPECIES: helix-hairpin-helix domain-containing protein [unclassified Cryobacterium]|uniref:helix-hairpin-helix domain-containing protein n=1 Tax=unclassified Cryobacterium TaxID=2649013 RepID=UPI002AB45494|nr:MULTISPECIES: helix-hairpin-helix domain-containing protein [unclassified Cryobacterium]MDY7543670.1 helix-hairpin-helix domain-containing protein [Cryobacterium sp. 5B3]MEA9997476.1 helix-hairpin-helix domain-containing protein [Cryobacterium sp. RTS3]MEB0264370.1 helix-hairpin-helix domain-containing protein [Cryobacterium sp. 10I5]MEB0273541.1 helix-hairpin-helix domain-containing protein [Cryobacterium sp. 5B3]
MDSGRDSGLDRDRGHVERRAPADGADPFRGRMSPLDTLAPAARRPNRARLRIGLGAAVVLLLAALLIAVIVTAIGPQAGQHVLVPAPSGAGGRGTSTASPGAGSASGPSGSPGTNSGASGPASGAAGSGTSRASPFPGATTAPVILVHVLGAVLRPGLFELPVGARVVDAVSAAGGFTAAADPAGTNLARPLADGEQVYLPAIGETVPGGAAGTGGPGGSGAGSGGGAGLPAVKVNLNRATAAELDALPRIGPAMAQRIVDYRSANGPFASVEDLRNVTGIGDKTFEALKDLVTV